MTYYQTRTVELSPDAIVIVLSLFTEPRIALRIIEDTDLVEESRIAPGTASEVTASLPSSPLYELPSCDNISPNQDALNLVKTSTTFLFLLSLNLYKITLSAIKQWLIIKT